MQWNQRKEILRINFPDCVKLGKGLAGGVTTPACASYLHAEGTRTPDKARKAKLQKKGRLRT
jgi:hypothetical protein